LVLIVSVGTPNICPSLQQCQQAGSGATDWGTHHSDSNGHAARNRQEPTTPEHVRRHLAAATLQKSLSESHVVKCLGRGRQQVANPWQLAQSLRPRGTKIDSMSGPGKHWVRDAASTSAKSFARSSAHPCPQHKPIFVTAGTSTAAIQIQGGPGMPNPAPHCHPVSLPLTDWEAQRNSRCRHANRNHSKREMQDAGGGFAGFASVGEFQSCLP